MQVHADIALYFPNVSLILLNPATQQLKPLLHLLRYQGNCP